jgi:flagellar basal-body rod modification protein FlgD
MDVASLPTTAAPATPASRQGNKITSDFTTFLKMLTTQMQNQDPLNPLDSADFAVQLATFSGVEQQVQTNQLLAAMTGRFSQMGISDMAAWIGQEARTSGPAHFDGTPLDLTASAAPEADRGVLVVKDANGKVVSREEIPVSKGSFQWLGGDITGAVLPKGQYSFTLESWAGEKQLSTQPVDHYSRILEARTGPSGAVLILEDGIEVPAASVTGLRLPQGA